MTPPRIDDDFVFDESFFDSEDAPVARKSRMLEPSLDLGNKSKPEIVALCYGIQDKMTENAVIFTAPPKTMPDFLTEIDEVDLAIKAADDGKNEWMRLVAVANGKVDGLKSTATDMREYVSRTAKGSREIILAAGMPVSKDKTPVTVGRIENLSASAGDDAGEVDVMWNPIKGSRMTEIQTSGNVVPQVFTTHDSVTGSKVTLKNLPPGELIFIRARARGANNDGAWSDVVQIRVP